METLLRLPCACHRKHIAMETLLHLPCTCHRKHIAMETLLQRSHFGAVIWLHFGTPMNNGSQHVGSKTGARNLSTLRAFNVDDFVCINNPNLATFALHMPQETHRYGNLATALPFWSRYLAPFWDHYEQRVPTCGLQNGGKKFINTKSL